METELKGGHNVIQLVIQTINGNKAMHFYLMIIIMSIISAFQVTQGHFTET